MPSWNAPSRELLAALREQLVGKRIRFIAHAHPDPQPLTPGLQGTVETVDDIGTIHLRWDDGRSLGLVYGVDRYELVN